MTEKLNKTKLGAGLASAVLAILASVFALEKGYVNDPNDPGGETNHGVTVAVARQHGYQGPMISLPKEMAADIYYKDYIDKPGYLPLIQLSPALGEEVVDSGVNAGPGRSSLWFQKSLNALNRGGRDYPSIEEDGRLGPAGWRAPDPRIGSRRTGLRSRQRRGNRRPWPGSEAGPQHRRRSPARRRPVWRRRRRPWD